MQQLKTTAADLSQRLDEQGTKLEEKSAQFEKVEKTALEAKQLAERLEAKFVELEKRAPRAPSCVLYRITWGKCLL